MIRLFYLIFIFVLIFFVKISFAKNQVVSPSATAEGDCVIFSTNQKSENPFQVCDNIKNLKVLNASGCRLAFQSLKDFCEDKSDYLWPESSYIFDHLLDVWFRKLDALDDLVRWSVDNDWQTRRIYVNKWVENIKWVRPQQIVDVFNYYWNPNNWILFKKYLYVCDDIEKIISKLITVNYFNNWKSTFSFDKDFLKRLCIQQVYSRYYKEEAFIRLLLIKKGNLMLENEWKNYVIKQFVQQDWQRLVEKFSKFVGYLTRIVKLIWEWAKNCNR